MELNNIPIETISKFNTLGDIIPLRIRLEDEEHRLVTSNITEEIYEYACEILDELWNHKTAIRQLGVHTSKVCGGKVYQYNLFDMSKYDKLNTAADKIRNKYGDESVMRASFIGSDLDHMAEGHLL